MVKLDLISKKPFYFYLIKISKPLSLISTPAPTCLISPNVSTLPLLIRTPLDYSRPKSSEMWELKKLVAVLLIF